MNLTIELGSGKTKLDCSACAEDHTDPESGDKTGYKDGEASQWYTSFGIQLTHLSRVQFLKIGLCLYYNSCKMLSSD